MIFFQISCASICIKKKKITRFRDDAVIFKRYTRLCIISLLYTIRINRNRRHAAAVCSGRNGEKKDREKYDDETIEQRLPLTVLFLSFAPPTAK